MGNKTACGQPRMLSLVIGARSYVSVSFERPSVGRGCAMAEENCKTHAKHFDRVHSAQLQSRTLQDIWHNAYGDDYPAEVNPSAFYSRPTFRQLVSGLQIEPGQTIVDLGCGTGGAGLWVAQDLGVKLIGIDLSAAGVAAGRESADAMGLGDAARFLEGDMTATGLASASCDGALSLDVLCFVPDKPAVLREVARILRPGARFGFTTWEQEGYSDRLKAVQLTDHAPTLPRLALTSSLMKSPPAGGTNRRPHSRASWRRSRIWRPSSIGRMPIISWRWHAECWTTCRSADTLPSSRGAADPIAHVRQV